MTEKELKLSEKELHLIEELRKLPPYGETHVVIYKQDGELFRMEIERGKESIKL